METAAIAGTPGEVASIAPEVTVEALTVRLVDQVPSPPTPTFGPCRVVAFCARIRPALSLAVTTTLPSSSPAPCR